MAQYPAAIEALLQTFSLLPGVGRKTAERYTLFLVKQSPELIVRLVQNLQAVRQSIRLCERCFNFTTTARCGICSDSGRDQTVICVVAEPTTIAALELTGQFHGTYHVLGGTINHLEGVGPEKLHLAALVKRVQQEKTHEIILATNPDLAGDTTALYIAEALKDLPVQLTKLARGLAAGSDIDFADDLTLSSALQDRRPIKA